MIPRYQVLRQRISFELDQIERAAHKAEQAWQLSARGGKDESFYLDSVALNLHGFYNGVERLFEMIGHELDGTVPRGAGWHRELLAQMELQVPAVRPAVIRTETRVGLEEYLRFRHLVRNLYTWDFAPPKLQELVSLISETLSNLKTDLESFRAFLEQAGRADESDDG